ncbi:hypothetical protein A4H97_22505 [Niastella yeongjuensis]|uniref:Uncharacterized protein n=1 Tax=Niastella yeongjuensis TaxID=354355 RepID=A0A1V9F7H5_9BACT|nr:hypothetical protein A4H97_22505 [Niastella yeongjuensis]
MILFVQLVRCFTAEAGTPLPENNIAHQKSASLLADDLLPDHFAEVAHAIQFTCVASTIRDHRDSDGSITLVRLSNYNAGDLHKRIKAFSVPHSSSFIRLLLFPNHYFW